jgi:Flp pilus assembly pilin Flp
MWATPRRVSVPLSIDNGGHMKITTAISAWLMTRAARRGERGATAVEYGIMIAAVAAVLIFTIDALMDGLGNAFDQSIDNIDDD